MDHIVRHAIGTSPRGMWEPLARSVVAPVVGHGGLSSFLPSCGDYAPTLASTRLVYVLRTLEAGQTTADTRRRHYAERKPPDRHATLAPTRATMTACEGRRFPYAAAVADVATSQQRPLSRCRIFVRCRQGVDEAPPGGSGATGRVNMNAQSSESLFSCLHLQICLREKVEQLTGIGKTDSTIQASVEAGPVHDTTTYRCALDCRLQ